MRLLFVTLLLNFIYRKFGANKLTVTIVLRYVKDRNHKVVSILGFRFEEFVWSGLVWSGNTLVIDNFTTKKSARGEGFAGINDEMGYKLCRKRFVFHIYEN